MKKIVFVGDSITAGIPGVSYKRYLHKQEEIQYLGSGVDTLYSATIKINRRLGSEENQEIERYILQIGMNDVLFPVLKMHSFWWKGWLTAREAIFDNVPCTNLKEFKERYERLLVKLRSRKKDIAVIGLPIVENQIMTLDNTMERYNKVIRELCKKYKVPFLDLRTLELNAMKRKMGSYFVGKTNLGVLLDGMFTSVLPFSNAVSKWRGLSVTVDGIHMNHRMAKKVAKMVELKILEERVL